MLVKSFFTSFLFTFSSFLFTGCIRIVISNGTCHDIFFKRAAVDPELEVSILFKFPSCYKSNNFRPKILFALFPIF